MYKLKQFWNNLRGSFWFVPSLFVAVSVVLAVDLIESDSTGNGPWMAHWPRLFGSGAAGAHGMLSTIAGSMMTVVGVAFSMTLVVLALASSQYTSRILRNFMRDRVTQVVLGIFAGIFTYCLIVLRTICDGGEGGFIPNLAVTFGVVLAISGLCVLIFFIHYIASSIQASNIIATVADETIAAVDRLFPERLGKEPDDEDEELALLQVPGRTWHAVMAPRTGYIQNVDVAALLRLAREHHTIVRMERHIGAFAVRDTLLASLALAVAPDKQATAALQGAYGIDRHRTLEQDAAFGIRQIVDIALRALSPGINDTTAAVMCVDYLTAILARLASRPIPSPHRYDEGELRIITLGPTFALLVAESFDQIRGSAQGNVSIMLRRLGALQTIAERTASPGRRQALRQQADCIADLAQRTIDSPHDQVQFADRLAQVREALKAPPTLFEGAKNGNPDHLPSATTSHELLAKT